MPKTVEIRWLGGHPTRSGVNKQVQEILDYAKLLLSDDSSR